MNVKIIPLPTKEIKDWKTFHDVFKNTFGFPDFYGANMDAWIDCMSDIVGMTQIKIPKGDLLVLQINNAADFKQRCEEQYCELIDCSAFVNSRQIKAEGAPIITLMLIS